MSDIVELARERLKHIKDDADAVLIDMLATDNERLRAALRRLRDCDWVITLPDRMDAVREIARKALDDE